MLPCGTLHDSAMLCTFFFSSGFRYTEKFPMFYDVGYGLYDFRNGLWVISKWVR